MAENEITPVDVAFKDEDVELPADTLAILSEFLKNKLERESSKTFNKCDFEEDWVIWPFHSYSRPKTPFD